MVPRGAAGRDVHHAQALPQRVSWGRDPGCRSSEPRVRIKDIAADFGISESCPNGWLKRADVEDGIKLGVTEAEHADNRELRKPLRLLEMKTEVLRRSAAYLS